MIADPADPELLVVFGSGVLEDTDGVFARVAPSVAVVLNVAWIMIVTAFPLARVPRLRLTPPPEIVQLPTDELQEVKVTPAGGRSLNTTFAASSGPEFVNWTV
jgi:hypothetical protein